MESNKILIGRIALVAGGSRGCGKGIALALGDAGATVYVSGRTTRDGSGPIDGAPGTIEQTAEEVTARGGVGIAMRVDHTDPAQVTALFDRILRDHARLDILACAVWGGNERYLDPVWKRPFWEQAARVWNEFLGAGPHAFWLAAHAGMRIMAQQKSGLIVAITEPIVEALEDQPVSLKMTFADMAHSTMNQLITVMAPDASRVGVAVIGLLPGFMRTERVEMHIPDENSKKLHRYDLSETPGYAGRALVALAADSGVMSKSGKLVYVADLAEEYDFTDVDGVRVANFYKVMGLIK
jgi:NAD(P)-dependent dehydrogenase (short-subunit alcohol dehydrogenase family)